MKGVPCNKYALLVLFYTPFNPGGIHGHQGMRTNAAILCQAKCGLVAFPCFLLCHDRRRHPRPFMFKADIQALSYSGGYHFFPCHFYMDGMQYILLCMYWVCISPAFLSCTLYIHTAWAQTRAHVLC